MLGTFEATGSSVGLELAAKKTAPKSFDDMDDSTASTTEEGTTRMRKITKLGGMAIKDHFSLPNPSSRIGFADDEIMVLMDNLEQITIEKKKDNDFIVVKQATIASPGIMLLRLFYTLTAFFMAGLVFVFCIQIVLFLFLGLAIESGKVKSSRTVSFLLMLIFSLVLSYFISFHFMT